jgi:hypothetical protein
VIKGGKLLSAEQSVRLAMLDSTEREKLIEAIVAEMRVKAAKERKRTSGLRR